MTPPPLRGTPSGRGDELPRPAATPTEQECVHTIARGGQITANFVSIDAVDETEETSLILWPNPASQTVYIEGVEAKEVQVYNTLGQMVKSVRNSNEVSLEGLVQGVYMVRITSIDGSIFTNRLVIR